MQNLPNQLTLNVIKSKSPCTSGWEKLLKSFDKTKADETPVSIAHLLDSNGINDTLWVIFNCIPDELQHKRNMLADLAEPAIKAAESVLHIFEEKYPEDKRPRDAIENAKENLRRARAGEERLPRSYPADVYDYSAAYDYAAATYAAYAAYAAADAAAAAHAAHATYAAYAAYAAAYAYAAAAHQKAREKAREKQKEIILTYFQ